MTSTLPYVSLEALEELEQELRATKPGWSPDIDALEIAILLDLITAFRLGRVQIPASERTDSSDGRSISC